jgi:hypothetical protein
VEVINEGREGTIAGNKCGDMRDLRINYGMKFGGE